MGWQQILSTIEKDINLGFGLVAPIVGTFNPGLGPVLTEIGTIIGVIEGAIAKGSAGTITPNVEKPTLTAEQMSAIVQGATVTSVLKQYVDNKS